MDLFIPSHSLTFDDNIMYHWKCCAQELELYLAATEKDKSETFVTLLLFNGGREFRFL